MRKKLFLRLVPLMALVVSLQSCRTNEDLLTSKEEYYNSNKFQVFTSQDGKAINYSDGFKFLIGKYDSLNNTQYSKSAFLKKGNFDEDTAEYVEFNIHSQDIIRENGERWVFYPRIKNAAVSGIAVAILSNKEETVELRTLNPQSEYYGKVIDLFRAQYIKSILNLQKSSKGRGPGFPGQPPADIPPVVITIPNPGGGGGWTDPGGGDIPPKGCSKYQNCIADPDGAGGGGNNNDPQQNQDPCAKMKMQNQDLNFKAKVNALDKKEMFDKSVETGHAAAYGTTPFEQMWNTPNGNVRLPDGNKYYGYMHTHLDKEGVIKIFSPYDIATFLTSCVANAKLKGNMADAYAMVITSQGNYILKYSGDGNFAITNGQIQNWNTWYRDNYAQLIQDDKFTQPNVEKLFTQFLKEQVNINGLDVYKSEKVSGNTEKLKYNGSNNPIQQIPCPQ